MAAYTSFLCTSCHTEIQASPDMVGLETECPACGAKIRIPAPDDDDVVRHAAGAEDPDGLMEQWHQNGQMYMVRQGVLRQKAAAEVVENAIVTEEKPAEKKAGKHSKKKAAEKDAKDAKADEAAEAAEAEKAE